MSEADLPKYEDEVVARIHNYFTPGTIKTVSKIIEVAKCRSCPYREGGELYCLHSAVGDKRLEEEKLFDPYNDTYIAEWCPLPDSKGDIISIDAAGSIAANLFAHLPEKDQALVIAGFQECIKYLSQENNHE